VDAWPTLPDALRAGILAMVRSATPATPAPSAGIELRGPGRVLEVF
jgi:hypothetical protein